MATFTAVQSPRERIAAVGLVITIHVVLAMLLLIVGRTTHPRVIAVEGMTLVSIGQDHPSHVRPPPPKLLQKPSPKQAPLSPPTPLSEKDSVAGPPSAGCATLASLTNRLLTDPAAAAAILNAPPESQSIAGAVVLWNAGWPTTASTPDAPLGAARAAIERVLEEGPPSCLDEQINGPRFVPIPDGERTIMVVLGSGQWTWHDMLSEPFPEAELSTGDDGSTVNRID